MLLLDLKVRTHICLADGFAVLTCCFRTSRSELTYALRTASPSLHAAFGPQGPNSHIFVPGGEDPGAVLGDRDRELEVRGERAILRIDGPVVVAHTDLGPPR